MYVTPAPSGGQFRYRINPGRLKVSVQYLEFQNIFRNDNIYV